MFMSTVRWLVAAMLAISVAWVCGQDASLETARYVRFAAAGFATECQFQITRHKDGWTITSRTDRGSTQMEIESRYDAQDRPITARAVLTNGGIQQTATVQVKDRKAIVSARKGEPPVELDAPKGTVITSAPDWCDVFLLCRRYDAKRGGKQEFPGLWIHPTEAPRRLTFTIERQGTDSIDHAGKKIELGRYHIIIRNNSSYVAWADADGRMIRLIPLPFQKGSSGLTLEGFEKAASGLRPESRGTGM
jgi:hypothetical protein